MSKDIAETLLESVKTLAIRASDQRRSLTEFAKESRLEPMAMLDRTVTLMEPSVLNGLVQTCLSLYVSYYLQFVAEHVSRIGNVSAQQILDPKMDDRSLNVGLEHQGEWNTEAFGLLNYETTIEPSAEFLASHTLALGSGTTIVPRKASAAGQVGSEVKFDNDFSKPASLAVGKLIHVPVFFGEEKTTIPVSVRMNPRVIDSDFMVKVLRAFVGKDQSFLGRWHRYNAGEIKSIWDWMTGWSDIAEDTALRLKDKDGMYNLIRKNMSKGRVSKMLTGKSGFQFASNAIIISKATAMNFARAMKMNFAKIDGRNRFFQATGSMLLIVVDEVAERATLYQHGMEEVSVMNFKAFESASTNPNAINITEVMAAYKAAEAFSNV